MMARLFVRHEVTSMRDMMNSLLVDRLDSDSSETFAQLLPSKIQDTVCLLSELAHFGYRLEALRQNCDWMRYVVWHMMSSEENFKPKDLFKSQQAQQIESNPMIAAEGFQSPGY